jgi:hypothetical protein
MIGSEKIAQQRSHGAGNGRRRGLALRHPSQSSREEEGLWPLDPRRVARIRSHMTFRLVDLVCVI